MTQEVLCFLKQRDAFWDQLQHTTNLWFHEIELYMKINDYLGSKVFLFISIFPSKFNEIIFKVIWKP